MIKTKVVTITTAQLANLHTAPVELLPISANGEVKNIFSITLINSNTGNAWNADRDIFAGNQYNKSSNFYTFYALQKFKSEITGYSNPMIRVSYSLVSEVDALLIWINTQITGGTTELYAIITYEEVKYTT